MGDEQRLTPDEQIALAREQFDTATDFSVAVEEEFAILDPGTLDLSNRFEEVQAAAAGTALAEHLVGELIASEVEIRTGRCETFTDVPGAMAERRSQLQSLVEPMGILLGATARTRGPTGRSSGSSTRRTTVGTTSCSGTSSGATTPSASTPTSRSGEPTARSRS